MHSTNFDFATQFSRMKSAIFITFSGNCKEVFTHYHKCFGGQLQIQNFAMEENCCTEAPVICASLISDSITILGSDLVHNEGRMVGNHMAVYVGFENVAKRRELIGKLAPGSMRLMVNSEEEPKMVELVDAFNVRWILGI